MGRVNTRPETNRDGLGVGRFREGCDNVGPTQLRLELPWTCMGGRASERPPIGVDYIGPHPHPRHISYGYSRGVEGGG